MCDEEEYKNPHCEPQNCISMADHFELFNSFYALLLKGHYHEDKKMFKFTEKFFEKYRIAICEEDEAEMWCSFGNCYYAIELTFSYSKPQYFKNKSKIKNNSNAPWFALAIEKNPHINFVYRHFDRSTSPIPVRLLYKDNES